MADIQEQAAATSGAPGTTPPLTGDYQVPSSGLPSLNPADSPYKPLDLPQRVPRQIGQSLSPEEPNQNLGAVSKGGAIAYMADKVLRGAVQGYDARQVQKATQFNKKMSALSALQQQLGQQYKEAYEKVGSSKPEMTPEQILQDPEVKQLHNQLLAVHQTTLDAIGKYLPPLQTDQKTGKQKEKRNLLERMFGQEPDESLRAYQQAASQLGPTAFYQVASPQQLQAMYEQRRGKEIEQTAQTAESGIAAKKAAAQTELIDAESSGDAARIEKAKKALEDFQEATSPYRRPTEADQKRADYQAMLTSGQIPKDHEGNPLSYEAWTASQSAAGRVAGAPPKVMKYDNNTGTVSDPNTGKTYSPRDLDLPLQVASIFKAADDQAFKKQQRALQLVAERGNAYLMGRAVQVADPSQPGTTIYMRAIDAIRQGVPTPSSIWFKMEMPTGTERARADLAISAREQLNTMDQILQQRKDLFGPAAGRATDFTKWVGSQDPDAQRFAAAARIAADHLAGVFGGRSKAALDAIYDAIGQNKTNPAAAVAALEQMNIAAAAIQGRGTAGAGVVPPAAKPTPTPAAKPSAGGFDWNAHPVAQ